MSNVQCKAISGQQKVHLAQTQSPYRPKKDCELSDLVAAMDHQQDTDVDRSLPTDDEDYQEQRPMFIEAPMSMDVERPLQTVDEDYPQQRQMFIEAPTSKNVDRPLHTVDLNDGNPNCSDLPLLDSTVFEAPKRSRNRERPLLAG